MLFNRRYWLLLCLVLLIGAPFTRAEEDEADNEVIDEEVADAEESLHVDGLTAEEVKAMQESMEVKNIGAQTDRMMKLIIHSLYKNKDIFLRELISNASDALDKIRIKSLTDKTALDATDELSIKIKADTENNILHITDTGIGMTKEHLQNYLGVIAKSGTADLFDKIESAEGAEAVSDLIGQFGVGFYSSFLVADKVLVTSKNNDDDQYIWESDAGETYKIVKDPRGNTLPRGTTISLYMKEESQDFLQVTTLNKLVERYSQFINFPIYIWEKDTITEEVELTPEELAEESDEASDEEELDDEDDAEVEEDDSEDSEDSEPKKKTKKVTKEVEDYKLKNSVKPIWTRPTGEVSDEEYEEFYKQISKDNEGSVKKVHFAADGEIGFKAILYIPKKAAKDLYTDYGGKKSKAIKLYVRRVFITDDFSDMMPKYLNWVVGIVDSDDLPLNVSREQLQQDKLLKVIKKKLVRKALDMIKKLEGDEYKEFWENFGTSIKLGVIEDSANRNRLAKLLRFQSSNSDELTSLEEYVERMKEKQEKIYFVGGNGLDECKKSPFNERLIKKGYEVLYMTEPVDEYAIQALPEFDGKRFHNVAKEGLNIDEGTKASKVMADLKTEFEPLTRWLKEKALKDLILDAEVSERLTDTPAALVASSYGWSGNMQRIMEAQAYKSRSDTSQSFYAKQKKKFEINARHPLIKNLNERVKEDEDDEDAIRNAQLMFDTACLRSDFDLRDKSEFAGRILDIMYKNLGIDSDAQVEEEEEIDEDEEEDDDDEDADELDADDDEDEEDAGLEDEEAEEMEEMEEPESEDMDHDEL